MTTEYQPTPAEEDRWRKQSQLDSELRRRALEMIGWFRSVVPESESRHEAVALLHSFESQGSLCILGAERPHFLTLEETVRAEARRLPEAIRQKFINTCWKELATSPPKDTPMEPMLKTYAHHSPDTLATHDIRQLRQGFSDLHKTIEALCQQSRERSVALTQLETAAMWAVKSRVCNDPASKVEG